MKHQMVILLLIIVFLPLALVKSQSNLENGIAELTEQITAEMAKSEKFVVAVVEFSDLQGNVSDLGRLISEELITQLYSTNKFRVIERQLLNKVISEQNLSLKGLVEPRSAAKLGSVLGVEAIVTGTITDLYQTIRINARLISAESGEIFAVASTKIEKDASVKILLSDNAQIQREQIENAEENVVELNGFRFQPINCEITPEGNLNSVIRVINVTEEQKVLNITHRNSYVYDDLGNEYAAIIKIGDKISKYDVGYNPYWRIEQNFIPEVPVNVQILSGKKVPKEVQSATVIFTIQDWDTKPTIKNIPVSH